MKPDCILVVDFGAQYGHLIVRRVRELGVYSELVPHTVSKKQIASYEKDFSLKGFILSGGPASVHGGPQLNKELLDFNLPILGLCYGHQLLAHTLGGKVVSGKVREYGLRTLNVKSKNGILKGLGRKEQIWMSHGDTVVSLPDGFEALASTQHTKIAAFANEKKKIYGLQFHPEVTHTLRGKKIFENFAHSICKAKANWRMADFITSSVSEVKKQVGEGKVLMALSGGVDSSVAATLIHKAVGDGLFCVYVDHGLARAGDPEKAKKIFIKLGLKKFFPVDAAELFLSKLEGVADPEQKRKIIADTFIEVFERKAEELESQFGKISFLGQGTIYPDRIESAQASGSAERIKSHHNVVLGAMSFEVVEPLRDLYKDEVRQVGKKLGLPADILWQWPFPGPGLAVRCLGEVTTEKLRILKEADFIVESEVRAAGLYGRLWQAFPVLIPVRSVGVMGDQRTYEYMLAVRAVESEDAMTANFSKLPWDVLEKISSRIVNEVKGVNRVLYDITNKPPSTIEFE